MELSNITAQLTGKLLLLSCLAKLQPENQLSWRTGKTSEVRQQLRWVDDILYRDSDSKEYTMSVIECHETKPGKYRQRKQQDSNG
jgi:hypothetical protein